MSHPQAERELDVIVVGSGPSGATIARSLARRGCKVLVLERGGDGALKEGIRSLSAVLDVVPVGEDLSTMRALTAGGTTAFYGAIADPPPIERLRALGVDLSAELAQTSRELSVDTLPDELLGEQVIRVSDSARQLGLPWVKRPMLVDRRRCPSGYSYEAKWNARTYLTEAVSCGARVELQATVDRVMVEGRSAVGVEYEIRHSRRRERRTARAHKVVLAAGALASPLLLRRAGIANVGSRGFYCDPALTLLATVPGLRGRESFVGCMGTHFVQDICYGDASLSRVLYRMWMLGAGNFLRAFMSHGRLIGMGFIVKDQVGGTLDAEGRYRKALTDEDRRKLREGAATSRRVLENAGGRNIWMSSTAAARVGGLVCIGEHVDERLQTEIAGLHVCDGSILPEETRVSPTLSLICLGQYLAKCLTA